jgi:hypothetical protein
MNLDKPRVGLPAPTKIIHIRLVQAFNLPFNCLITKLEAKIVDLDNIPIGAQSSSYPILTSDSLNPEYNAVISHKFEHRIRGCWLVVRLVTIDSQSSIASCSLVGYSILPLYNDIDSDEPATKRSKVVVK